VSAIKQNPSGSHAWKSFIISKPLPSIRKNDIRMQLNLEKRPAEPPKSGENPRNRRRRRFRGPFPGFHLFGGTRSAPFGLHRETIMDINMDINSDDRKDVQPYPVEPWPESRREGNSPLSRRERGRGGSLGH
jgi:hypothetical protein